MELNRVSIRNYRSIKDLTIKLQPKCRVLVGINESGKSNILKALSLLGDAVPSKEDKRIEVYGDDPIEEAFVRFVFKLDEDEIEEVRENAAKNILCTDFKKPIITRNSEPLSLEQFCKRRNEGLYQVDFLEAPKKETSYWALPDSYKMTNHWKKKSPKCPSGHPITIDGKSISLSPYVLIEKSLISECPEEYFVDPLPSDINAIVGSEVMKIVKTNLPKCVLWNYDEKQILPPVINLDAFASNPETCIPLKNMFVLAKHSDIQKKIQDAKNRSSGFLKSFLQNIAEEATTHFRTIWKEYKSIKFDLSPNGPNINALIREKNFYELSQRSDGFKRFISFLLLISSKVKSNTLNNTLLLIDEPDVSLHPKGIQYLRDELIRISKSNYVVYSTHSPFMIDRDRIERHLLVTKENEETKIEDANDSNIYDEEVLYNAMGYSAFEIIKKKNVVFEGWRDKKLFQLANDSKDFADDLGFCHAEGVNDIKRISSMLELANRDCFILSDSDDPAKEQQREFIKRNGYGKWRIYQEVDSECAAITGEDFLKIDYINKSIDNLKKEYPELQGNPQLSENGHMKSIDAWLGKQQIVGEAKKSIKAALKEILFEKLKRQNITEEYFKYLDKLKQIISPSPVKN